MTLATIQNITPTNTPLNPFQVIQRGRRPRQKKKTMAEELAAYHQRIYQLYRQAVDF